MWKDEHLSPKERKDLFAARLIYGLGFPGNRWIKEVYDTEYFAVMAEAFTNGPEYFFDMFGDYYKPGEVVELHDFTQNVIFGGWEYKEGVPIRKPLEDKS